MDTGERVVVYVGAYDAVADALRDIDALEHLHDDELVGRYDAAVVDMHQGRPRIVRTVDHPRVLALPERLGAGPLPRSALKEAAKRLSGHDAALIVLGTPTIAMGVERATRRAKKLAQHDFDDVPDVIGATLTEALDG